MGVSETQADGMRKKVKHEWARGQIAEGEIIIFKETVDAVDKPLCDSKIGNWTKWSLRTLLALSSIL